MNVLYIGNIKNHVFNTLENQHKVSHYSCHNIGLAALRGSPESFELIVIDIPTLQNNGIEMIKMIRVMEDLDEEVWKPILVLANESSTSLIVDALNAGADDYLDKELIDLIIRAKILAIKRIFDNRQKQVLKYSQLQQESLTDVLTGISNRRHFNEVLKRALTKAQRHNTPLSIAYFDLDHFKRINDTYGHDAGDEVLRRVSQTIKSTLRSGDTFGRLGGEEFCIAMPDTAIEEAFIPSERYRKSIEALEIIYEGTRIPVTASFGIVQFKPYVHTLPSLLAHADEALYASKKQGRNKVTLLKEELATGVAC